jgi:tRNA(Ile)-lysidine synthase
MRSSSSITVRRPEHNREMLKAFLDYVQAKQLLEAGSRTLLAISGGLDSVVMAQLFKQAGLLFGIAHCNFKLRADDADEDERFVARLAANLGVPFYSAAFDTAQTAREAGISIQMAARQLRYEWLESIRSANGYSHIATAHHLNDSIETLLYNLAKGCGIRGLHGIPPRNGHVIRPLLFATRDEIEQFALEQELAHREDSSNAETKYSRNKIRHQVIPGLKAINPSLESTMAANIERLRAAEYLYDYALSALRSEVLIEESNRIMLIIKDIKRHDLSLIAILYELLSPYGFNASQAGQMAQSLDHAGASFYAPDYRLLVDRDYLILEKRTAEQGRGDAFLITAEARAVILTEGRLSLSRQPGQPAAWPTDPYEAALDAGALVFPLFLRRWQPGDSFQPLGMGGKHQKVQDFFTNNKVSLFDKERAWILEDAQGRICWLLGYRIDERFCIKADTKAHWVLKYEKIAPILL